MNGTESLKCNSSSLLRATVISDVDVSLVVLALFRPPDIHVGGLMFYHGFFLLLLVFRQQLSALAERNSTKTGHIVGNECENACPKSGASHPLQIGGGDKTAFFRPLHKLTANLMAYIFGRKRDINKRVSALATRRVSYIVSKRHELWSTNWI